MCDFLINLLMSLVTGGYMGIVVSKVVTFSALKREALRSIRKINYIDNYTNTKVIEDLPYIISDILGLGHLKAGTELAKINREILTELDNAERTGIMNTFIIESSQSKIRDLKMSKSTLLNPLDFRV